MYPGKLVGSTGRVTAHGVGGEDRRAEQTDRPRPDEQRPPDRALPRPKRESQTLGEGQRQEARDDEVSGLHPTVVVEAERANRVTKRLVSNASVALDEERGDEQRADDRAAVKSAFVFRPAFNAPSLLRAEGRPLAVCPLA